jgi:hypothetical protein
MEINLGQFLRVAKKEKSEGRDALSDGELYMLAGTRAVLGRVARRALGDKQQQAEMAAAFELFKSLPPEEQEKYEDWTPQQLQALWPLIEEQGEEKAS